MAQHGPTDLLSLVYGIRFVPSIAVDVSQRVDMGCKDTEMSLLVFFYGAQKKTRKPTAKYERTWEKIVRELMDSSTKYTQMTCISGTWTSDNMDISNHFKPSVVLV